MAMDAAPLRCVICKQLIAGEDDVAVRGPHGVCTCYACYNRALHIEVRVDPKLAAEISAAMGKDL